MNGNLNKIMLIGQLGDQVKIHYFEDGNCIARFPLATNESYTDKKTQKKVTTTQWHNIIVKNKQAQSCEKYLTTGDKVYIEGKVKTTQWISPDGKQQKQQEIDNFTVPNIDNDDILPF